MRRPWPTGGCSAKQTNAIKDVDIGTEFAEKPQQQKINVSEDS
jgi:hypothetical protein